ncbi:unnamed protein product [Symbiodinium necroappetens]|uniref:Uncharacterized protein n=1 Tax=Symbiodinium necroappetens TaxID=1628268 RepID=A0A813CL03_9DINO|nr:unnamed protein product [Symbiodinium necroappetens]
MRSSTCFSSPWMQLHFHLKHARGRVCCCAISPISQRRWQRRFPVVDRHFGSRC